MANYVENLIINEGTSAFTVRTFIQSDGVTGELTNSPVVAASELNPALGRGQYMSIYELWYSLTNFSVVFSWKTLTGVHRAWVLSPGTDGYQTFQCCGGLVDSSGLYAEGQLLMSTTGFTTSSSCGSFVLRMRKHDGIGADFRNVGVSQGVPPGTRFAGVEAFQPNP